MEQRQQDHVLALFGAWQGERFARVDRLRSFRHYAKELAKKPEQGRARTAADRLAEIRAHRGAAGATITKIG